MADDNPIRPCFTCRQFDDSPRVMFNRVDHANPLADELYHHNRECIPDDVWAQLPEHLKAIIEVADSGVKDDELRAHIADSLPALAEQIAAEDDAARLEATI